MLEKNYLQECSKQIMGMAAEINYRIEMGCGEDFEVEKGVVLKIPDYQLEREKRMKKLKCEEVLAVKLKNIEEKSKGERRTVSRASTSETKFRFLEVIVENWDKMATEEANYAQFFLVNSGRNQYPFHPPLKALMRLLDTADESESLHLLHSELFQYARVRGVSLEDPKPSLRDVEMSFSRSLCSQLRNLERGKTQPNLREIVLLRKFLLDVGVEKYIFGGGKVLIEVRLFSKIEQERLESVNMQMIGKTLNAKDFVERVRTKGTSKGIKQQTIKGNRLTADLVCDNEAASEEVFTEDVLFQVPGQDPLLVVAGQPVIKTPVKKRRLDKPNIDKEMKLQLLKQVIMVGNPLGGNVKLDLRKVFRSEKVETVFKGEYIEFVWHEHYQFKTIDHIWHRYSNMTKDNPNEGLGKIFLRVVDKLRGRGMKIADPNDVRQNIQEILGGVLDITK